MLRSVVVRACLLALVLCIGAPAQAAGDPYRSEQWGLTRVKAPQAWDKGRGEGVTIAIVDSGIDPHHEDLAARIDTHVSCLGADGDPSLCRPGGVDDHGHGTHVAGIAAATAGNGKGVAGVAPAARIMAVRVLRRTTDNTGNTTAGGDMGDIRAGVIWAVDHGADVVNLSLGESVVIRNVLGSGLESAIDYAWDRGVIPVVATGNAGGVVFSSGYTGLPALVVTATDPENDQADYATNPGAAQWGISAPGGEGEEAGDEDRKILSTYWSRSRDNSYAYMQGTSMATPHVAGAAAVLLSAGLDPEQVVHRITSTATDLGVQGRDGTYGWGLLNLAAATKDLPDRHYDDDGPDLPDAPVSANSADDMHIVVGPAPTAPPASDSGRTGYRFDEPSPKGDKAEDTVAQAHPRKGGRPQPQEHPVVVDPALPTASEDGGSSPAPYLWAGLATLVVVGLIVRRGAIR